MLVKDRTANRIASPAPCADSRNGVSGVHSAEEAEHSDGGWETYPREPNTLLAQN